MNDVDFKAWPKIPRENPFNVTITEKIDGTNACIIIKDGEIIGVQSRKRLIVIIMDLQHGLKSIKTTLLI